MRALSGAAEVRSVALEEHDLDHQEGRDPSLAEDAMLELGHASRLTRSTKISILSSRPSESRNLVEGPPAAVSTPRRVPLGVIAGVAWIRRI